MRTPFNYDRLKKKTCPPILTLNKIEPRFTPGEGLILKLMIHTYWVANKKYLQLSTPTCGLNKRVVLIRKYILLRILCNAFTYNIYIGEHVIFEDGCLIKLYQFRILDCLFPNHLQIYSKTSNMRGWSLYGVNLRKPFFTMSDHLFRYDMLSKKSKL